MILYIPRYHRLNNNDGPPGISQGAAEEGGVY